MAKTVSRMPSWAAWLLQFICGILAGFAFISAIFILVKYILSGLRIAEGTGLEKTVGNGFKAVPWATWVMAGGVSNSSFPQYLLASREHC